MHPIVAKTLHAGAIENKPEDLIVTIDEFLMLPSINPCPLLIHQGLLPASLDVSSAVAAAFNQPSTLLNQLAKSEVVPSHHQPL